MRFPIRYCFPNASQLVLGCMRLGGEWDAANYSSDDLRVANGAIEAALESGINCFDLADIYALGKSERVFGQVLKSRPTLRSEMILISKAGIHEEANPPYYDLSSRWLESRLEETLRSLSVDYIDLWLLHRPDPLLDPDEIAELFIRLKSSGKVKHFGVSNMNWYQIEFLQNHLSEPLVVNQVELSLAKTDWIGAGLTGSGVTDPVAGSIQYCQERNIQIQAWGALAQGLFCGARTQPDSDASRQTAHLVKRLSEKYDATREAVVLAWIMRHPAGIQPVIGTTRPDRIAACGQAVDVHLTREDWYALYIHALGQPLP